MDEYLFYENRKGEMRMNDEEKKKDAKTRSLLDDLLYAITGVCFLFLVYLAYSSYTNPYVEEWKCVAWQEETVEHKIYACYVGELGNPGSIGCFYTGWNPFLNHNCSYYDKGTESQPINGAYERFAVCREKGECAEWVWSRRLK